MLNAALLMGRLTHDPELRATPNNNHVCSFSIAVERDIKGPNGEKGTDFLDIVTWGKTAEAVSRYFTKGRMIAVKGRIQTRSYEDKQGNKRKAVEVVAESVWFCGDKPANQQQQQSAPPAFDPNAYGGGNGFAAMDGNFDDSDLPF